MFKTIKQLSYKFRLDGMLKNLDFFSLRDDFKTYMPDNVFELDSHVRKSPIDPETPWMCPGKYPNSVNVFFRNIRIYIEENEHGRVVKMFVKNPESVWDVVINDENGKAVPVITTDEFEVYHNVSGVYAFNIKTVDTMFIEGAWNKTVWEDLTDLMQMVEASTPFWQFNQMYAKYK